jgi:glycosyltransferase involved in cell wall biosynthesis
MKPIAYFETSTLFEQHWTGIAAVGAGLAAKAFDDSDIDWRFFFKSVEIPRRAVGSALEKWTGDGLADAFVNHYAWTKNDITFAAARQSKGFFCHIKTVRNFFAEEGMFLHDLTPLLVPQFHAEDTIRHFADRIRLDVESSTLILCNSRATLGDLDSYLSAPSGSAMAVPMGVHIDLAHLSVAQLLGDTLAVEPYVVVLGTLEPRKNGTLVLRHLLRDPGFADRFRIVFVGRDGWLDQSEKLLEQVRKAGVKPDRIVFTGFLSEQEKTVLIYNARFCIYPSYFEGFGLPILEAAILGKMIAVSNTSSMPEVAPDKSVFFDPRDEADFARALKCIEMRSAQVGRPATACEVGRELALRGSWAPAYRHLAEWAGSPVRPSATEA